MLLLLFTAGADAKGGASATDAQVGNATATDAGIGNASGADS